VEHVRESVVPRAPHADEIDLRRCDAAGEIEAPRTGLRPGDRARQGGNVGRLRPWRRALRAEIAFPAVVLGPVLASALARLASRRAALVTPPPPAQRPGPRSS
jgi:hypothetical protein